LRQNCRASGNGNGRLNSEVNVTEVITDIGTSLILQRDLD